jgi:hypothetical protein
VQTQFSNSKFFNWIKATLAILYTKEELEPVVFDEIENYYQTACP